MIRNQPGRSGACHPLETANEPNSHLPPPTFGGGSPATPRAYCLLLRDETRGATPAKAICVLFNQAPYAVIARRSRGIRALSDIEGKTLGVNV